MVGRARFERATIALKEPCFELETALLIELKEEIKTLEPCKAVFCW
jgi:hypothetical protein